MERVGIVHLTNRFIHTKKKVVDRGQIMQQKGRAMKTHVGVTYFTSLEYHHTECVKLKQETATARKQLESRPVVELNNRPI